MAFVTGVNPAGSQGTITTSSNSSAAYFLVTSVFRGWPLVGSLGLSALKECCDPGGQRRGARECIFHFSLPYPSLSVLLDCGVVSQLTEVINFKPVNQHFRKALNFVFLVLLLPQYPRNKMSGHRYEVNTHLAPVNTGTTVHRGLMS